MRIAKHLHCSIFTVESRKQLWDGMVKWQTGSGRTRNGYNVRLSLWCRKHYETRYRKTDVVTGRWRITNITPMTQKSSGNIIITKWYNISGSGVWKRRLITTWGLMQVKKDQNCGCIVKGWRQQIYVMLSNRAVEQIGNLQISVIMQRQRLPNKKSTGQKEKLLNSVTSMTGLLTLHWS